MPGFAWNPRLSAPAQRLAQKLAQKNVDLVTDQPISEHLTGREGCTPAESWPDAQELWNADLQRRMSRTVWSTGGCASWYLDAHGRDTSLWPRTTYTFRRLLDSFDVDRCVVTPQEAPRSTGTKEIPA